MTTDIILERRKSIVGHNSAWDISQSRSTNVGKVRREAEKKRNSVSMEPEFEFALYIYVDRSNR